MNYISDLADVNYGERSAILLSIYCFEDNNLKGNIYNKFVDKSIQFETTIDFLFALNQLVDIIGLPKSSVKIRTFKQKSTSCYEPVDGRIKIFGIETMQIDILYRHNATLQGSLKLISQTKSYNFRSAYELLSILFTFFN